MAVGFPTKVTYANGDVYSASDVNDTNGTLNLINPTAKGSIISASAANTPSRLAVGSDGQVLTADSSATTGLAWTTVSGTPITAGKNGLINGGFDIWQRGTAGAGPGYIADRWYSALISGTGTFAQESTVVPSGSLYSQKFTASATAQPALYQAIETQNAIRFAGQTVTVSAKVAASTSTGFTIDVQHSSSTDNSVTGTWTSITATSGGTATATSTTFVNISGVYAVPSTAKSLRFRIFTTSTIANTVVVYFGQAQIEQGNSASSFSRATGTFQNELAACQRYYFRSVAGSIYGGLAAGQCVSTTGAAICLVHPVTMRIVPTSLDYANIAVLGSTGSAIALSSAAINYAGFQSSWISIAVASGLVAGNATTLTGSNNTAGYIGLSAEL